MKLSNIILSLLLVFPQVAFSANLDELLEKVKKAIDEVGKENGYTFILNSQNGLGQDTFLYSVESIDITHLVLKKLGVNMTPEQLKAAREKIDEIKQCLRKAGIDI